MSLQDELKFDEISVQQLNDKKFSNLNIKLNVLRLDKIHPVVSGNKWFKLKYWLQQAVENKYSTIATFGGAFSNHIIATAYACNKQNLNCIGFIRGEEPKHYSQTLLDAKALNMQLKFLSREDFVNRKKLIQSYTNYCFIPEGGYGIRGANGAAEIINFIPDLSSYKYIVCAVGTGTMIAGIVNTSLLHQQCIGISVLKNNFTIEKEIYFLLDDDARKRLQIFYTYHFGGYAKYTNQLLEFMNNMWLKYRLPLDFVYTAKALFGVYNLAEQKYFTEGSKILFIHSGGLQGNRSFVNNELACH